MNAKYNNQARVVWVSTGVLLIMLAVATAQSAGQGTSQGEGKAAAAITLVVPADAKVFFDGDATTQTGTQRLYTSPYLQPGKTYHYNILVRWDVNGKLAERTRKVKVTAGERVFVSFLDKAGADTPKEKDKQVVTSKASKRTLATSVNFKKEFGLPFASLGTLGARIDAARRTPDPVALGHTAAELAVAEKVSGKKASLTSKAVMAEAAELARLRRQVAELKALAAIKIQVADEEANARFFSDEIAQAEKEARQERDAVAANELPTDAPRKILLNNYTTQYIDLWVNGNYKMQIPPGSSKWCVIEHKFNPTTLTAYGNEDDAVWGPRQVYGAFTTYTWNLQ